jgi:hypothetical protein
MSTSSNTKGGTTRAPCADGPAKQATGLDNPLASWRTLLALDFTFQDVKSMRALLAKTTLLGQPKWAAAVAGDGPAAVAVAISFIATDKIAPSMDLAMTALIACAIEGDPGAAIVASNILRHLPAATPRHHRIATSWFVSNLATCASRKTRGAVTELVPLTNAVKGIEPSETPPAPETRELWRTIPANKFTDSHQSAVVAFINKSVPRMDKKVWMGAIAGDALCAIRVAREITHEIDVFTRPLDVRLTLLLNCALNGSAEAAFELSSQLGRMPLETRTKARLKASWLDCGRRLADVHEPDTAPRSQPIAILVTARESAS